MARYRSVLASVLVFAFACAAASCSHGDYTVVVRFDTTDLAGRARRVDVSLIAACGTGTDSGAAPVGAGATIGLTHGASDAALGDVQPGSYGLYARAFDSSCQLIGAGCAPVKVKAGGSGELTVSVVALAGPSDCSDAQTCMDGTCVGAQPDGGTPDGGAMREGGQGDAGAMDAATDGGPISMDAGADGASGDAAAVDAGGMEAGADGGTVVMDGGTVSPDGGTCTLTCPLGCSTSGGPHCLQMIPSNVDPTLLSAAGTDDLTVGGAISMDTTSCAVSPIGNPSLVSQTTTGPQVCVVQVHSLMLDSTCTLTVTGTHPLAILASGDVTVLGSIDVSAAGTTPGPGALSAGTFIGGNGQHVAVYDDGGGGGGSLGGTGGVGGRGGSASGGPAGHAVPAGFALSPLVGGGSGGQGGTGASAGGGGGGGGALQISALGTIDVEGMLTAGGGGGQGGRDGTATDYNIGSGGGGGSGGGILLEAPTITFTASGSLRASGGGGGGGAGCRTAGPGAAGTDGDGLSGPASGGARGPSCSGNNYGANGGSSGGGSSPAVDGASNTIADANGGGGGGGAGYLVLRTGDGTTPSGAVLTGFSPSGASGVHVFTVLTR